jgi:hypothetical protein
MMAVDASSRFYEDRIFLNIYKAKLSRQAAMIRWTLTVFVALIVFSALLPWLEKLGIGRLPGDVRFTLFGRTFFLPFASTILLSLIGLAVARLL